jgi:nucleotide-binding universal stress UspA family protein
MQFLEMHERTLIPPDSGALLLVRSHCDLVEVVGEGNAAEQILLTARKHAVDLIVLGAHHRSFLEFAILGSTTERVMRHADSAVLVVSGGSEAAA